MKIKVWEDEHELVLRSVQQGEMNAVKGIEHLEQSGYKSVESEEIQAPSSSDHISGILTIIVVEISYVPDAPNIVPLEPGSMLSPLKASPLLIIQT